MSLLGKMFESELEAIAETIRVGCFLGEDMGSDLTEEEGHCFHSSEHTLNTLDPQISDEELRFIFG